MLPVRSLENEEKQMRERRAAQPELAFLDDYLQGKITHMLVVPRNGAGYDVAVWSVDDQLQQDRTYLKDGLKVICLFGQPNRDLRKLNKNMVWRINNYRDGSGGWYWEVVSFHSSKEEAREAGRQWILDGIDPAHTGVSLAELASQRLVDHMIEFGLDVPEEVLSGLADKKRAALDDEIVRARLKLDKLIIERRAL
jgi:hypothetical protein